MSYSPTVGRFLEQDPAGYVDGPNRYPLELDNPIDHVDPTGLASATTQPTTQPAQPTFPVYNAPVAPGRVQQRDNLNTSLLALSPDLQNDPLYKQQCLELATRIVNAVDSKPSQVGGAFGNWERWVTLRQSSGCECGDWQALIQNQALQPFLDKYGSSSLLRIFLWSAHLDNPPMSRDHQWVGIAGDQTNVTIDPWPSGGDKIEDPSYVNGHWSTQTPTQLFPTTPATPAPPKPK